MVKLHKVKKPTDQKESEDAKAEKTETNVQDELEKTSTNPSNQKTDIILNSNEDDKLPVESEDNLVEISDPDDYLLYLESILKNIHKKFYEVYDETKEIPDLKELVPRLKSEVLKDGKCLQKYRDFLIQTKNSYFQSLLYSLDWFLILSELKTAGLTKLLQPSERKCPKRLLRLQHI